MTVSAQPRYEADPAPPAEPRFEIKTAAAAFEEHTRAERHRLRRTEPDFDEPLFDEARALVFELLRETTTDGGRLA